MNVNRLKAVFATGYTFAAALVAVLALAGMAFVGPRLAWLGTLLTVLPFLYLFARVVRRKDLARINPYLPGSTLVSLAGAGLAAQAASTAGGAGGIAAVTLAVIGCGGFLLYNFWYSGYGRRINHLLDVGEVLPAFQAEDQHGRPVSSRDLLGSPALYMFFRGNWCPFCVAQVKEITARYRELIERGVQVALVSPQPHDLTQRVAEQYGVPFRFWVDVGNRAAVTLRIAVPDGLPAGARGYPRDTVMPTVVITGPEGRIIYTDQTNDYRVRPHPDDFLRALKDNGY